MFRVRHKENKFQWKNYKKGPPQHYRKQNRYSQTPVRDHPESEGLVHGRLKESAWDLIQEEVWAYVPLERKLIACSMCIYVFSQRFLHTTRAAFYIQRTSDHVLSGRLQTLKLMENYETVTPEND